MQVKLRDDVSLEEFVHISFGVDKKESYSYIDYFSLENIHRCTNAVIVDNVLVIDVIGYESEKMTLSYHTTEDKAIWAICEE